MNIVYCEYDGVFEALGRTVRELSDRSLRIKSVKIRVKNREPLPSYAMELSDDYQEMVNPGGGDAMGNLPLHRQHTPDSPLVSKKFYHFSILC